MRLGTAVTVSGGQERRFLAAPTEADPGRIVDLQAVEVQRLSKFGEGNPEVLAQVLMPTSLRLLLESGSRGIGRAWQTLSYAEKWARKLRLPDSLAPHADSVRMLACLPRPSSLRMPDGTFGDRLGLRPPGALVPWTTDSVWMATLAAVGKAGGRSQPAGYTLVLCAGPVLALGPWLHTEILLEGELELESRSGARRFPLSAWRDLQLPELRSGEVQLLPFPVWEPLPVLPGDRARLETPFDAFSLRVDREGTHPTLQ